VERPRRRLLARGRGARLRPPPLSGPGAAGSRPRRQVIVCWLDSAPSKRVTRQALQFAHQATLAPHNELGVSHFPFALTQAGRRSSIPGLLLVVRERERMSRPPERPVWTSFEHGVRRDAHDRNAMPMQVRGGWRSGRLELVPCGRVADRYSGAASGRKRVRERKTGCSPVPVDAGMAGALLLAKMQGPGRSRCRSRFGCAAGVSIARATRPSAVPARVADVQFPQPPSDEHGWIRPR
jgi:hypothetical protein